MYAPNEYYRPYNPSRSREKYRERQRLPPQYVGHDKDKPLSAFRIMDTPPPPQSLNTTYSSLNTMDDLMSNKGQSISAHHFSDQSVFSGDECYCRISSLVKAFIFLGIILGATVGVVIFFLNNNTSEPLDLRKELADKTADNSSHHHSVPASPRITQSQSDNNLGISTITKVTSDQIIKSSKTDDNVKSDIRKVYDNVLNGFDDGQFNLVPSEDKIVEKTDKSGQSTSEEESVTVKDDIDDGGDNIDKTRHNISKSQSDTDTKVSDKIKTQHLNLSSVAKTTKTGKF